MTDLTPHETSEVMAVVLSTIMRNRIEAAAGGDKAGFAKQQNAALVSALTKLNDHLSAIRLAPPKA